MRILQRRISNIYQSNAHIGSGILSGSVAGFEQDEQGNLHFNPANFLLGLAGGAVGSKAISESYKKAKAKYYEKNFNKLIKEVNANKPKSPRFEVTKELEKQYRENRVNVSQNISDKLKLQGGVFADYIQLAQKHPEYFANPQEAKAMTEYIMQKAKVGIQATKQSYELLFAELQGGKGALALDLEFKGGKHRVRSVYLMTNAQYKRKVFESKRQGGPILQF